ncbi:MAG: hypothetical protein MZW92_36575 [Comamonadaceae bacterium]|nr:hypothetical protein [Comamonadaceae bacterium]
MLAIKKKSTSAMIFNPSSDEQLELGDSMIVLGDREKVDKLKLLAKDSGREDACIKEYPALTRCYKHWNFPLSHTALPNRGISGSLTMLQT